MRIRKWLAVGLMAVVLAGIGWNILRESPEEAIERIGGRVSKQFRGPAWVPSILNYVPSGDRLLEKFSIVEELAVDGTNLSDEDFRRLASFTELRVLTMPGVRDAGLESIGTLRKLQVLSLGHPDIPSNITDAGLAHLAGCTRLAGLNLEQTRVTGAGLQHLRAMSNLRYLNLANTRIGGPGLAQLAALPKLEQLDLSGTPITDADLEHLRGLSAFTLILRDTPITEAGLSWLNRANGIVGLDLAGTQVTDGVFHHFLTYPELGRVNVQNTRVTPDGVEAFFRRTTLIDVQFDPEL
jgi:hypothetical protein